MLYEIANNERKKARGIYTSLLCPHKKSADKILLKVVLVLQGRIYNILKRVLQHLAVIKYIDPPHVSSTAAKSLPVGALKCSSLRLRLV